MKRKGGREKNCADLLSKERKKQDRAARKQKDLDRRKKWLKKKAERGIGSKNEDFYTLTFSGLRIPPECWSIIYSFLDKQDMIQMSRINKEWRSFALAHHLSHKIGKLQNLDDHIEFLNDWCPRLQHLDLSDCSDLSVDCLGKIDLPVLRSLDLSGCTHLSSKAIGEIPDSITHLHLRGCTQLRNVALEHLPENLHHLDLSETLVSSYGLNNLPSSLKSLVLSKCYNCSHTFEYLPTSLISLDLSDCVLIDKSVAKFNSSKLQHLNLSQNNVSSAFLATCCLVSVTVLNLSYCDNLDQEIFALLKTACPILEVLIMTGTCAVREAKISDLPGTVTKLDLCKTDVLGAQLEFLPENLRDLDLSYTAVDNPGLLYLKQLQHLKKLAVRWCKNISDEGFRDLPEALERLDVAECRNVLTNDFVSHLPKNLKVLDIVGCWKIDEDGLKLLPKGLMELHHSVKNKTAVKRVLRHHRTDVICRPSERFLFAMKQHKGSS